MTAEKLNSYSIQDLAEMARKRGVRGWKGMRKPQLVKALAGSAPSRTASGPTRKATKPAASRSRTPARAVAKSRPSTRPAKTRTASRTPASKPTSRAPAARSGRAPVVTTAAVKTRAAVKLNAAKLTAAKLNAAKTHATNGRSSNGHASHAAAIAAVSTPVATNGRGHMTAASKPAVAQKPIVAQKPTVVNRLPAAPTRLPAAPAVAKPAQAKVAPPKALPAKGIPPKAIPTTSVVAKAIVAKAVIAKPAQPAISPAKRANITRRLEKARQTELHFKNISSRGSNRDRLVVMVRDSFWLHATWELTRQGVQRAEAAMGQEWHGSRPVLRLLQVASSGTTNAAARFVRDIEIHGGVNNWYIDVKEPPQSYRVDIGYLAPSGKMFVLARSNVVCTPPAGASAEMDQHWAQVAENYEKIYAMSGGLAVEGPSVELQELFEERLRRPMGASLMSRVGAGSELLSGSKKHAFAFEVDAEMIVYGKTEPDARVTLQGDPVKLRPDGTFTVRYSLPNCRQVIPAVAVSRDGLEQRTVVLAVERNTKTMEPVIRDAAD